MKNSISRKVCLSAASLACACIFMSGIALGYSGEAVRLYNEGTVLVKEKKYTEAADSFEKAIFEDATIKDAYFNLGAVYKELGQNDKAKDTLARLVRQDPFDDEAVYLLGEVYFDTADYNKALVYLNTIPEFSKRYDDAQKLCSAAQKRLEETKLQAKKTSRNWDKKVIAGFETPAGVTTDSHGNIYVANYKASIVEKITPSGIQTLKSDKLKGPVGLAVDAAGNVYVAGFNSNNIIKILPSGQTVTFVSGLNQPYYLFIQDDILYITEQGKNNLVLFNLLKD
jgi:tetratricopeptide (TPR) repeat protein